MHTQINITESGTTTLATAGKYCDRNIDVNVNVEDSGADVFAGLVQGTIEGAYVNDKITSLRPYAFAVCDYLTSISLPNCTTFTFLEADYGCYFRNADSLKTIDIPNLTTIENGARCFNWCKSLKEFDAPNLTSVTNTSTMFSYCTSIRKINLPKLGGTTLSANTFPNCYNLEELILGGNELNPLANVNAFSNTGSNVIGGFKVYVPDDLVESYRTATNWSNFADQIKPISELEE